MNILHGNYSQNNDSTLQMKLAAILKFLWDYLCLHTSGTLEIDRFPDLHNLSSLLPFSFPNS